jgi:hypothetical protein
MFPKRLGKARIYHSADLEFSQNMYRGWTVKERQQFQNEAFTIIRHLQLFPIAAAVIKADFDALRLRSRQFKPGATGNYYMHAFQDALNNVRKWLYRHGYEASVQYVFEQGDLGWRQIREVLDKMLADPEERKNFCMRGVSMEDKDTLPLQAADIWAYESCKHIENRIISNPAIIPVRYPWRRLYRARYEKYQTYSDRERLERLLEMYRKMQDDSSSSG